MMGSRNSRTGMRVKNARVKKRSLHMTRKQGFFIALTLFLLMGTSIGYVWSNFERTQIGYDLSRLKKEEIKLIEVNRKLRLELAILKSPQNLERMAVRKLGLRPPTPDQIIVLP